MNCLPCFNRNKNSDGSLSRKERSRRAEMPPEVPAQVFNFRELAMATKNFRQECLLGEGGFGRVFKGTLQESDQLLKVVAVKQLDRNGMEGSKEFSAEVLTLNRLKHPNLVNLIGYCADGDQRLLVYEYLSLGSLDKHLFGDGPDSKHIDWVTRMKIASGAAQGLEYLHEKANPPVIYGDVKPSNILLDENFEPKLSDVGLAKLGAYDAKAQPQSRAMGTFGHSAPEYSSGGEISLKSDIYSFGVVLLELITGRRAIDTTRPTDEQNLVTWAQPFFRDPKRFSEMADPRLNKQFPATSLNQAVGIAAMCLQDEPMVRPLIDDVTSVLSCISMMPNTAYAPPEPQKMEYEQNGPCQGKGSAEGHSGSHGLEDEKSDEESGSYSQSDDSEEESTDSCAGNSANGKPKKKANSSRAKNGGSRQTVVTFKEPSMSSRYSPGGKPKTREESSSSSEVSSSESEDDCDSAQSQGSRAHSDATENGFSSREVSDSCLSEDFNSPEGPLRRRGATVSAI